MAGPRRYLRDLSQHAAAAWTRFWLEPSDAYDLCLLRILIGALAVVWQVSYAPDLTRWFGADGWLASSAVQRLLNSQTGTVGLHDGSYLFWISDSRWLWTLHLLGTLVLVALTLGFYTRLASVASLIVLVSYIHRAPLLTGPMEPVLTMMVAYLCLAPAGRYLSLDSRWRAADASAVQPSAWATVARRLIQVHLVLVYLVMGLTKLGGETWWYGEAVWWLAAQPDSQWFDPSVLRAHPILLNFWTQGIVIAELSFAVFIWNDWLRPLMLVLSAVIWITVALATGYVGLAAVMMVANLAFVPATFWLERDWLPVADRTR